MPDIWVDVDTAVHLPVNIMPLIDPTDFKTVEVNIAYNETGMNLAWNFVTTAGVQTTTAVTPTTAGLHDWVEEGTDEGMYSCEIPASTGTVNNDTEGFGWWSGTTSNCLPFRGPIIGFRAAALNNALIDGGDNLDVNVTQYGGTNGTFASGRPEVNTTHVGGVTEDIATETKQDIIDANIDQIEAAVITNAAGVDIAADIAAVKAETATILVDTNSLNDTKIPNTLNTTASGNIGIDWANVENPTTAVDLSGTDIQLVDTCTTNTDMRGTDSANTTTPPTAAAVADAVLDEALAGHVSAGTLGKAIADIESDATAILADTNELQGDWANTGRLDTILDELTTQGDTNETKLDTIDTVVDGIQTDLSNGTDGLGALLAAINALNDISAADVNAQVLDVLNTDTFAELGAVPAATSTIVDKLTWVFMLARNQLEQTATTTTVRADNTTTSVATSTVSDDGTTATRGEFS